MSLVRLLASIIVISDDCLQLGSPVLNARQNYAVRIMCIVIHAYLHKEYIVCAHRCSRS